MAFESYARNLYAPVKLGPDLSLVIVTVAADGTRDADNSSPDTTVTAAGAGVYDITFPKAERGYVIGQPALVTTASDGVFVEVKAFAPTSGTIQLELSDEANLSSSETITLTLLLGGA